MFLLILLNTLILLAMNLKCKIVGIAAFMTLTVSSCRDKEASAEHIVPLYRYLSECADTSNGDAVALSDSLHVLIRDFFAFVGIDTVTPYSLSFWAHTPPVRIFTPDVDSVFHDLTPIENSLGGIIANAKEAGLDLPRRNYAAIVFGKLNTTMFATDSTLYIALNHYLGPDYQGYTNLEGYQRVNKTPKMLPYDIAEALVALRYPMADGEHSVAERMLYEGALAVAKMRLVPESKPHLALGYLPEQYEWLEENEADLWRSLVGQRMLYEKNTRIIDGLFAPSPITRPLSVYSPGRAGRYLGYKIAMAYLKSHNDRPLNELLSEDFYSNPQTLVEAKYNP